MEIDHLREFLVLAETRNYWEASERLFIGQSTLSKHIRSMEAELGVPLFNRSTRRVELTPYGQALLPHALTITGARLSFQEQIRAMKEEENGRLTLGVIPSMVQYGITDLLMRWNRQHPDSVRVLEGDTSELKEALDNGRCSLAFLRETDSFPIDEENFEKQRYMTDRAILLLPKDHPLAKRTDLTLSDFAGESFIMMPETSILTAIFENACLKAGFQLKTVFSCQRMDSIFDLVARGMGISMVMDHHLGAKVGDDRFRILPLDPPLESRICLCRKKGRKQGSASAEFYRLVNEPQAVYD